MSTEEINAIFSAVVETTEQGLCLVNGETCVVYANDSFCRMIGACREQVVGRSLTDFLTEESRADFFERQNQRTSGQLRQQYELNYVHGETREVVNTMVSASPILDSQGQFRFSLGMHSNITELRQVQEELDRNLERLNKAQELAGLGFWEYFLESGEVWWSQEVHNIFGSNEPYSRENFLRAVHPDDISLVRASRARALESGKPDQYKVRVFRPNGEVRHVLNIVEVERDSHGAPWKLSGVIQDITEQVVQQETMEQQRAHMVASSKLSTLGEMAGGIAHEINTPLAVVLLNAESLLREIGQSFDVQSSANKRLHKIIDVTQRIAKIVNGLRAFSRSVEQDPTVPTPLKSIVDETLQLCLEKFKNYGVEIRVAGLDPEIAIECRSTQISQVLLNLLNNSFDAISNLSEKWILIEAHVVDGNIEISVTDSGPGIPVPLREKIFNPFFTTKELGQGTGLGLSTSKGLIESHGGSLWIDPKSANTRFVIRLPLKTLRILHGSSSEKTFSE